MRDKKGFDYDELVAIQTAQLRDWGMKLMPNTHNDVSQFCILTNRKAKTPEETHQVYRGQDLIEIIRQWPVLKEPYRISPVNNPLDEV